MISRKEVLAIVAEKHGLILSDDDPILSVLTVSDAIYDIYTARLSEQMEIISKKNMQVYSQKTLSNQRAAAESAQQIVNESRRGLCQVLHDSKSDWQKAFDLANKKNQSIVSEFKKLRSLILWETAALAFAITALSLVIWIKEL
ncbi:MAG: hypothetical protein EOP04_15845 [Proteobacteria bacterium]|nr:MAG: hypothetical protein EOP04_15845 [Pseudomonadota bacterium]